MTQAEIDGGSRAATTTTEAERLRELEREVKELRRANAILRSASAFFAAELDPPQPLIIDYVDQHKNQFGVEPICAALTSADVKIAPSTTPAGHVHPRRVHCTTRR